MRKFISIILKPIIAFSTLLFPYALVLYLVLFLLENVFPGFVSYIYDINIFLIPVLAFGIFAALGKDRHEHIENKKISKWDILLILILSIIGFSILYYKTQDMGQMGLIISAVSALLIFIMSLVLFLPEEKTKPFVPTVIPAALPAARQDKGIRKTKKTISLLNIIKLHKNKPKIKISQILNFRYLKILLPVIVLILFVSILFMYFSGGSLINKAINNLSSKPQQAKIIPQPTPDLFPGIEEFIDEDSLLEYESTWNTPVILLNGGAQDKELQNISKLLTVNRIDVTETTDAENKDYKNITVRFKPDDYYKAKYITAILNLKYPDVQFAPLDEDKTTIEIIVGKIQ